jgi:enamine deaminase RidA (YjgF/YER057c/UK114 family)
LHKSEICNNQSAINLTVTDAGTHQAYIVASVIYPTNPDIAAESLYSRIAQVLKERKMEIVHERIFGSIREASQILTTRAAMLHSHGISPDNPVTYIQGNPPWGEGLAGIIIRAVSSSGKGSDVWTITDSSVPCGRGWQLNGTKYLILQNIQGEADSVDSIQTRTVQAQRMFERADRILKKHGATYKNVIRTWIYLSDILAWYEEFNEVRNKTYRDFGIMPGQNSHLLLPASTGIQGTVLNGAPVTMDLLSVVPGEDSQPMIKRMSSKRQIEAHHYYSAFSRGLLIHEPEISMLQVSGTAAIDEDGQSLYPGDIRRQIDYTFDAIDALIRQEDASLGDVCAATVFVKRPEDIHIFQEMAGSRGLENFPCVCVVADICRKELLFEIDAEVVIIKK